jgi:photosystem II stability/assembly factor-like uncharacterized protein
MDDGVGRSRAAAGWIAAAVVLVVVVGVVYLRPSLRVAPAPAPAARAPAVQDGTGDVTVAGAVFRDVRHGAVSILEATPSTLAFRSTTFLTSDGGRTWARSSGSDQMAVFGPTTGPTALMRFGVAGTASSFSYDAGRTWRSMPALLNSATFDGPPILVDDRHGWWLVQLRSLDPGGTRVLLLRTADGGRTWERIMPSGIPDSYRTGQLAFADARRGALTGQRPDGTWSLLETDDGGASFHEAATFSALVPGTRLYYVALLRHGPRLMAWAEALPADQFRDNSSGSVVVIGSTPHFELHPYLVAIADSGATWGSPMPAPQLDVKYAFAPVIDGSGRLLVFEGRRLWVSEDDGVTWTARLVQAPAGLEPAILLPPAGDGTMLAIGVIPTNAVSARPPSALLRSRDGGAHWELMRLPR